MRLIEARKRLPHLHASVAAEVLDPQDPGVLLVARRHPLGAMLGAYNVTDTDRVLPYRALRDVGPGSRGSRRPDHRGAARGYYEAFHLPPYAVFWLTAGYQPSG